MACFVNCYGDFESEAAGRSGRDATKVAMYERGGAVTDASAATKAAAGVWIIRHGLGAQALASVAASDRVPPEVSDRARSLIAKLRSPAAP
jgi:hypothetical protein